METAISVPDPVFGRVKHHAGRLGLGHEVDGYALTEQLEGAFRLSC